MTDDKSAAIAEAVARIAEATETRVPCAPVRDLIGTDDLDAAYAVQQGLVRRRLDVGATVVGRKIGATSQAVQDQLGVDQPDFGYLLADMDVSPDDVAGDPISMERLLQPRVEAEVAFVLGADLDGDLTDETVRAAVAYALPSIEIVDSRIAGWDITFADTVADNASSGLYVVGTDRRTLDDFEPVGVTMSLSINGEIRSTGNGAACLGDPLNALLWLAKQAKTFGDPLRAGQVILSGALGPFVPFESGDRVVAEIETLGSISICFK
ncbi:MAG: fumarylacetoacetate hydrolase family protein [Nocardioidaceae bacterium]